MGAEMFREKERNVPFWSGFKEYIIPCPADHDQKQVRLSASRSGAHAQGWERPILKEDDDKSATATMARWLILPSPPLTPRGMKDSEVVEPQLFSAHEEKCKRHLKTKAVSGDTDNLSSGRVGQNRQFTGRFIPVKSSDLQQRRAPVEMKWFDS